MSNRIVIAIVATLAVSASAANAKSCSELRNYCKQVNGSYVGTNEAITAAAVSRCDGYWETCIATGVWKDLKGTTTNVLRK